MTSEHALQIEVWFNHPPEVVFAAWTEREQLAAWFAAGEWQVEHVHFDSVVGSTWHVDFRHPDGSTYRETGTVRRVEVPSLLEFTLTQIGLPTAAIEMVVTVQFKADRGGTLLRFSQTGFTDTTLRNSNREGWASCFAKLREALDRSDSTPAAP